MIDIIQTILLIIILIVIYKVVKQPRKSTAHHNALILDSCAVIDARIVDIARAGFTPKHLIVPRFIIRELQLLADGNDTHKRERARFGLDMINDLQQQTALNLEIDNTDYPDLKATDDKLVRLASEIGADLCTTDYNLNKVATIEGVKVVNVNELANAVRPVILPGEKRTIKIVQKGTNRDQGVGYLEDGTMLVVSGAGSMVGRSVNVQITRMLQSDAGKMLFATLEKSDQKSKPRGRKR
jgi:uncharacterized protein YacL